MRGKYWFGMAAAGAVMMAASAYASPAFNRAAWLSDYAQLKTTLEKNYANLAWFASPEGGVDLPRLDRRTRASLMSAKSDEEARTAITDFVTAFKGGHFQVLATLAPAAGKPVAVPEKPFDPANPADACSGLGFVPRAPITFSLPLESLPDFTLVSDGLNSGYRTGIVTAASGHKIGVIHIQNFLIKAFPALCTAALDKLKTKGATIDAGALEDATDDEQFSELADAIKALKARGVDALLIDVGNNSGGDDNGDLYARLFTDKPVRSARLLVVTGTAGRAYFDEALGHVDQQIKSGTKGEGLAALTQAKAFFTQARAQADKSCDMSWVWTTRHPWNGKGCTRLVDAGFAGGYAATLPKGAFGGDQLTASRLSFASRADDQWGMWTGPLYVLTDGKSFSSAEMFAAVVQDNHIGKIVGQTTGGDGCGFMADDVPYTLDHSKMRLRIPDCMRLRADGSNEVTGIKPDIPVLPTDGEDTRQRANRLVEAVAADLGHP